MTTETISIEVDAQAARAFSEAPPEERRKMQMLLSLRLSDLTSRPARPLKQIMDEMGREAEGKGLTPEILERLLNDD